MPVLPTELASLEVWKENSRSAFCDCLKEAAVESLDCCRKLVGNCRDLSEIV